MQHPGAEGAFAVTMQHSWRGASFASSRRGRNAFGQGVGRGNRHGARNNGQQLYFYDAVIVSGLCETILSLSLEIGCRRMQNKIF